MTSDWWQAINHPRCINLLEVREDAAAVHLVEELASGGELFDRIIELGLFCEKDAVHLIHQVFDGIQYLHTHGMIHRDLKPENILMVGREPGTEEYMMLKICDFGLSAQRSEAKSPKEWEKTLQEFCGTQVSLCHSMPCTSPAPFLHVWRDTMLATSPCWPATSRGESNLDAPRAVDVAMLLAGLSGA